MVPSTWQAAWDDAQPRLSALREEASLGLARVRPRLSRVGHLDADLLDAELLQLLKEPLARSLGFTNSALPTRYDPELTLLVQFALYKLSIWDGGASYGAKLQGLRYHASSARILDFRLPRRALFLHGLLTVVVPYMHTRLRALALSRSWPDTPSSDRRRKAWDLLTGAEALHASFALLNFLAFLWKGRYRTLADRLLRLRLVPSQRTMGREVSYEFMNRQMVWHAFTEFLLFLVPLVNSRAILRKVARLPTTAWVMDSLHLILGTKPKTRDSDAAARRGKYYALPGDQCAICAENASFDITDLSASAAAAYSLTTRPSITSTPDAPADAAAGSPYPLHTPYAASCGHLYCYVCLAERLVAAADDGEERWTCLRCAQPVRWADRSEVEVDGSRDSVDEYEFSSDADPDGDGDMSTLGSFSESTRSDVSP